MENNLKLGIKYMLLASFLFALMGASAKYLSSSMNSLEIVFFRNLLGTALILYSIYQKPLKQVGGKVYLLVFRGFIGFVSLLFFFYNISAIPLAQAITFSQTSAIFTAVFAYIFIKEKLGFKAWVGVFIGFIGILFITKFDGTNLDKTDYLGILCGVGAALAYTSVRELGKYYESRSIVLSFMLVGTIAPLGLFFISSFYVNPSLDFMLAPFIMPSGSQWFFICLVGLFATFAQIFMTKAYSYTKAGVVGTISYSNIAFSTILGLFLGDTFPDIWIVLGIILIVSSGILVSLKNK
ncbi:MAG: DMT family transporter [Arcobacter sp.]|nr:DMT family transporter [Arcobacter sp.]